MRHHYYNFTTYDLQLYDLGPPPAFILCTSRRRANSFCDILEIQNNICSFRKPFFSLTLDVN